MPVKFHTEETKEKIRSKLLGRSFTVAHCQKISQAVMGRKLDKETLNKISGVNHHSYKSGKYAKDYSCIICNKPISKTSGAIGSGLCASCSRKSNRNPNYRNGLSLTKYGDGFNDTLRENIRIRDKYICQECGCSQLENKFKLDIHHIDYNKKNNNEANLISLCRKCHMKTNFKRNDWTNYYLERQVIYG